MDDLRVNKIVAGFLIAGLLAMGGSKLAEILIPHQEIAENAYPIEVTTQEVASAPSVAAGPEPILGLLADADIASGEKIAKKCTACHVFTKGGQNKVGPALWNIVGAPKASIEGFAYSDALRAVGGQWDYVALNAFLYKPKAAIKGTKMNFVGLKKPLDRANMIAYLRSFSDNPAPLPTEAEIAAESNEAQ